MFGRWLGPSDLTQLANGIIWSRTGTLVENRFVVVQLVHRWRAAGPLHERVAVLLGHRAAACTVSRMENGPSDRLTCFWVMSLV